VNHPCLDEICDLPCCHGFGYMDTSHGTRCVDSARLNQVFKLVHDLKLLSKMLGVELVAADRNLADHPPLSEMGLADLASQ